MEFFVMVRFLYTILVSVLLIFNFEYLYSQGNYKTDNGVLVGYYVNQVNWEESKILHPTVPGKINKIYMYLGGTEAKKDTFWIVSDPSEGYLPPSLYSYYISAYQGYVYNYNGTQGWHNIDISGINLNSGGVNGFTVQHVIKPNGPYFGLDTKAQEINKYNSFLNNVYVPNPDFINLRGTIISYTQNSYMVRCDIDYKYKNPDGTPAKALPPSMPDKTAASKLVDGSGKPIASEMASVVDWNKDGFQDIAIKSNFFQNNGDGTFTDVSTNINAPNNGTVWADVDNDGNLDFITANGWNNDRIYYGNGDGTFKEETDAVVIQNAPTISPMWIDYDKDGLVDLYIAYGRKEENGVETFYQDKLFKNLGNRKFKDVTIESGIAAGESTPYDCWGASITDYNNDGWPDIFVATYRLAPDLLYRNNKDGTFTEVGAATGARGAPTYYEGYFGHGMGSDWGDFDNDGDLDLCVGNLGHPDERALNSNKSLILRNQGPPDYKFSDFTDSARLQFFEMNAGTVWTDLDLDGYLDLVHSQYAYEAKGKRTDKNTRFYLNKGPDENFRLEDNTYEFGSYIHGAWCPVRGDFDNDGDMDIVVASSNENLKLFENQIPKKGNWISFVLEGDPTQKVNYSAYGSSIKVTAGGKTFYRALPGVVLNGRASQSSNELNFGIGNSDVEKVEVTFSNGKGYTFNSLQTNRKYKINSNGEAQTFPISSPQLKSPVNHSISNAVKGSLNWFNSGGAVSYEILIASNENFGNILNTLNSNNNSTEYNLEANKTYFWKVRAKDETTSYKWSDTWKFTTGTGVSVEETPISKSGLSFNGISPNPASDNATLSFSISNPSNIDISIFDNEGKLIKVLENKQFNTGEYIINYNLSDLSSGMYHFRISDGRIILGRKINIVR
jgi:hypothetical protein